jgi:hypothetical protein
MTNSGNDGHRSTNLLFFEDCTRTESERFARNVELPPTMFGVPKDSKSHCGAATSCTVRISAGKVADPPGRNRTATNNTVK